MPAREKLHIFFIWLLTRISPLAGSAESGIFIYRKISEYMTGFNVSSLSQLISLFHSSNKMHFNAVAQSSSIAAFSHARSIKKGMKNDVRICKLFLKDIDNYTW